MEGHSRSGNNIYKVQKKHIGREGESAQQVWRMHKGVQGKEVETKEAGNQAGKQQNNVSEV